MKKQTQFIITVLFISFLYSCTAEKEPVFKLENLTPWCILGFDSSDRTPKQRIAMLKEMGLKKYGYNKGKGHLHEMKEEFKLAKENDIEITSIFLWLNAKRDSIGKLGSSNQELLKNLKKAPYKPTIWVSFSDNFFKELSDEASSKLCVDMIRFVKQKADEVGCKLALYNHHGWFGNPYNQIEILEKLNDPTITMVYNFHHAQEYAKEFSEIVPQIKPYLSFVNISGVKKGGPQIITISEGDYELTMIQDLLDNGFKGPWGILGHIKTEDVQKVLQRNIDGLMLLNPKLNMEEVDLK